MELNEKKTKAMIIRIIPYFASIDVNNGTSLQYVDKVKNLGVTITPTLNWDLHVDKIQAKVYGALRSLNFHRRSFSFELKKSFIETLVMPHFDYASVVYNHLDKTRGKCLQMAHNVCIRFITGYVPFIPSRDVKSHVKYCRLELGWLSLAYRRFLQLLFLFYRVASTSSPDHSHRLIDPPPPRQYNPTYETRAPCPIQLQEGAHEGMELIFYNYWSETVEPT